MAGMYEAMFLLDPSQAPTWEAAETECKRLLDRAGARVVGLKRWDERKLAYEIKRRKRGTYALAFFEADKGKIGDLERDARLSDIVLRLLVLQRDGLKPEVIQRMLAEPAPSRSGDRPMDHEMGDRPHRAPRSPDLEDAAAALAEAGEAV